MKKIISSLLFSVLVLCGVSASAQFEKGDKLLNVGIGVGISNLTETYGSSGGFGLNGSYEAGIHDFVSVGGQLDFMHDNWLWTKLNVLTVGGRGSYHFGKHFLNVEKLDLYGGLSMGLSFASFKWDDGYYYGDAKARNTDFHLGIYAGGRYYFNPKMGVFAELGSNAAILKTGITFKM